MFYHYYFYDVPPLLNLRKKVYVVNQWQNPIHDNYAQELSDGLKFEPQSKDYLWRDAQLQQQLNSGEGTWVVFSRPDEYQPTVAAQQIWHYHNFDLFVFKPKLATHAQSVK